MKLDLPVDAMRPCRVWTRGRLFEQGRLSSNRESERETVGLVARFSVSGKVMRERGSFGSWEVA